MFQIAILPAETSVVIPGKFAFKRCAWLRVLMVEPIARQHLLLLAALLVQDALAPLACPWDPAVITLRNAIVRLRNTANLQTKHVLNNRIILAFVSIVHPSGNSNLPLRFIGTASNQELFNPNLTK